MRLKLQLSKELIKSTKHYFNNAQFESMIAIWLKKQDDFLYDASYEYIDEENYIIQDKYKVMLEPEYLAKIINFTSTDFYSGFILMHNHLAKIPLLSPDDIQSHNKLSNFLTTKKIDIIYGTAVYSNNYVTTKFNSNKIRRYFVFNIEKLCYK